MFHECSVSQQHSNDPQLTCIRSIDLVFNVGQKYEARWGGRAGAGGGGVGWKCLDKSVKLVMVCQSD